MQAGFWANQLPYPLVTSPANLPAIGRMGGPISWSLRLWRHLYLVGDWSTSGPAHRGLSASASCALQMLFQCDAINTLPRSVVRGRCWCQWRCWCRCCCWYFCYYRRRWDYFVSYEEEDWYGGSYHVDHLTNTSLDKGLD